MLTRADDAAGNLPYGAQRRLEIARAMCTEPALLCLDEPAAGLNARESAELEASCCSSIRNEHGTSILLIEHDMSVVMEISDHIVVLDYGVKIAEGTPRADAQRSESDRRLSRRRGRRRRASRAEGGTVSAAAPLDRKALIASYGNIVALKGVDLDVKPGEIVTLIGANGAGKSTLMMSVFGHPARARRAASYSTAATSRSCRPIEIAQLRIAQAPEGRRIFPRMTRAENLRWARTPPASTRGLSRRRSRPRLRAVPAPEGTYRASAAARCPAASSRCWRSAAR